MANKIKDPGFGENASHEAKPVMSKNGTFNVKYKNKPKNVLDTYHYLINISWGRLFCISLMAFFVINTMFALVYLGIGIEQITPPKQNVIANFFNAFFFSCQTFTTLGYGAMSPNGIASGIVSSIEAFLGLALFSFLTGLIYGRFSKPKASVRFSKHLVLRDFNNTKAIMFRLVNNRTTIMINPQVTVTLVLAKKNNVGNFVRAFYNLNLERDAITYLPTTWTVVHEIDTQSPLFNIPKQVLNEQEGELLIMIKYFDESFNQEVHQMCSYNLKKIKVDYKFVPAYYYNENGEMTLDYNLFDTIESEKS